MPPLIFRNGELLPRSEAVLPWNDAGFVYGAVVTDYQRTYHGRLFRPQQHLRRFRSDCAACAIPLSFTDAALLDAAEHLIHMNGTDLSEGMEQSLILFATPGPIGYLFGEPGQAGEHPTIGMHTFPLPSDRYAKFFASGVELTLLGRHPFLGGDLVDARIKHRSRLHWWLADRRRPIGESGLPLLCDAVTGQISETALGTFGIVRAGAVVLPPPEVRLASISTEVLAEICSALDIAIRYEPIAPTSLESWDEAFLVGSAFGIAGVSRVDRVRLPWLGPVTQRIMSAWARIVTDPAI